MLFDVLLAYLYHLLLQRQLGARRWRSLLLRFFFTYLYNLLLQHQSGTLCWGCFVLHRGFGTSYLLHAWGQLRRRRRRALLPRFFAYFHELFPKREYRNPKWGRGLLPQFLSEVQFHYYCLFRRQRDLLSKQRRQPNDLLRLLWQQRGQFHLLQ